MNNTCEDGRDEWVRRENYGEGRNRDVLETSHLAGEAQYRAKDAGNH